MYNGFDFFKSISNQRSSRSGLLRSERMLYDRSSLIYAHTPPACDALSLLIILYPSIWTQASVYESSNQVSEIAMTAALDCFAINFNSGSL